MSRVSATCFIMHFLPLADESRTDAFYGGALVDHEVLSMRIPNVCQALGLEAIQLLEMFEREHFRF